jgi:hypothetical protein
LPILPVYRPFFIGDDSESRFGLADDDELSGFDMDSAIAFHSSFFIVVITISIVVSTSYGTEYILPI